MRAVLPVAADSSFSFTQEQPAGAVTLASQHPHRYYSLMLPEPPRNKYYPFTITARRHSRDKRRANAATVIVNLTDPVTLIGVSNASGGGSAPLYTFAADRAFTNILQAEGSSAIPRTIP